MRPDEVVEKDEHGLEAQRKGMVIYMKKSIIVLIVAIIILCSCNNNIESSVLPYEPSDNISEATDSETSQEIVEFNVSDITTFMVDYYNQRGNIPPLYDVISEMKTNHHLNETIADELTNYAASISENKYAHDIMDILKSPYTFQSAEEYEKYVIKELGAEDDIFATKENRSIYDWAALCIAGGESIDNCKHRDLVFQYRENDMGLDVKKNDISIDSLSDDSLDIFNYYQNQALNIVRGYLKYEWDNFNAWDFLYSYNDANKLLKEQVFYLSGDFTSANYYGGKASSLIDSHLCIGVIPEGKTSIDKWYLYLDRQLVENNYNILIDGGFCKFACKPLGDHMATVEVMCD